MARKTLIIIGDTLVGKSCLVRCLMEKPRDESTIPTIMDSFSMDIAVRGQTKELAIHDMSGLEEWVKLRKYAYPGTDAVMIVFDISDTTSLSNVFQYWYPEVSQYCPNVPIILVGNKKDLRKEKSAKVDYSEGKMMAKSIGAQDYLECSTMTQEGIHDLLGLAITILFPKRSAWGSWFINPWRRDK